MYFHYFKKSHLFISLFTLSLSSIASDFLIEDLNRDKSKQQTWVVLPYIFSSESMGLTVGAVGIFSGYIQPQMSIVATTFIGEELEIQHNDLREPENERTSGAMLAINNYRPDFSNRLFVSVIGAYGYYPNQRLYIDGGNDSIKNLENNNNNATTPLQTQGYNNWFNGNLRYILPWGESKNRILPKIQLQRGIAVNRDQFGGGRPFTTGQTILGSELFYSKWSAEKFIESPEINTNGLRLYLEHNNTDYPSNPSRGYTFSGKISADFGLGNSTQSWNALEVDYAHYIELDNFSWSRQNIFAFNLWSAYSPSWNNSKTMQDGGILEENQTPMWEGARLGGWNRLRAYDSNRFNDKAALYGAVEYRIIPRLNPMADLAWNPLPIDWFQLVLFIEAGRVAEKYDLGLLLSDMKYDAGFSIRALAAKVPVRFEMAFGEEGSAMWFMIQQPF
ncbi:BamA/TamA family outer membrane protein [Psychromonas hadalis]|uniref:BamA/TamA family outer membrane protein n=1 Tax=Psychromonas hadalis TaxID=211669 RepID=UPI0003B5C3CA|nr:BamA/TamA family outer membrane protein [Psychromonas hadalis]